MALLLRDASTMSTSSLISQDSGASCRGSSLMIRGDGEDVRLQLLWPISRDRVSLSWLDLSYNGPRTFALPGVDLTMQFPTLSDSQCTLLAQNVQTQRLFVLQQAEQNVYALVQLRTGLSEGDFPIMTQSIPRPIKDKSRNWWEEAKLEDINEDEGRCRKRIKLDMARPISALSPKLPTTQPEPLPLESTTPAVQVDEAGQTFINSDQLFETLVCQTLDALYLSRTSLAFFAKGPLSRIRAVFTSPTNEGVNVAELAVFLRTMVISHSALDKKFKEKLPSMAEDLAMRMFNDDDDMDETTVKRRSRKKKKLKLNREGMYPFEEEYVEKWWGSPDDVADVNENRDEKVRRRLGDLRVRQTLIQMVILLEIMALEVSTQWKELHASSKENDALNGRGSSKKSKKPMDLGLILDLLIDKLCIWQSVELDSHMSAQSKDKSKRSKTWSQDKLESFCTDVLVPFYKSRVPDKTVQIIKRFGASASSPEKRLVDGKKSKSKGETNDKETRKPLARSTSQIKSKEHMRHPSLSRSMTDMPVIKREPSEAPSLSSFPVLHDRPKVRRDSMASLKHLKSRQISLSSLNTSKDRKRKHEALVEDELKSAIAGVKKPNRSMIGRQVADEREKLKTQPTLGRGTKSLKTSGDRRALGSVENVQVLATPHHNRIKPVGAMKRDSNPQEVVTSSAVKPVSRDYVPATDLRPAHDTSSHPRHALETPSKGSSRHFAFFSTPDKMAAGDSDGVPDSMMKPPGMMTTLDSVPQSSPIMPFTIKAAKAAPTYAFGRAANEPCRAPPSPLLLRRFVAVPATPVKRTSM